LRDLCAGGPDLLEGRIAISCHKISVLSTYFAMRAGGVLIVGRIDGTDRTPNLQACAHSLDQSHRLLSPN
jgi:hypothetical protein